ncbi:hypothetical protein VTN00DRAFT_890 [Thermoascus crustaceus]|uniref:uncharacterized protein n=1 Tax=Thermoascus crustaceus TaxID=5088 RepID=UPI003742BE3E
MYTSFAPDECANLHNQLLAKDGSRIWLDTQLEELPAYRFFSLLDSYDPSAGRQGVLSPTPQACQPEPTYFFNESPFLSSHTNIILLYGEDVVGSVADGGNLLRPANRSCTLAPITESPAPGCAWIPLQVVLQKWLDLWERGKYYKDSDVNAPMIRIRSWVEADLIESITAWDTLLATIESKIPVDHRPSGRLAPLTMDLLDQFSISPFAKQFLSRAQIPRFEFVAPGITVFPPESFAVLYGSEPADSTRLGWVAHAEPDGWPTLLLPAVSSFQMQSPTRDDSFDEDWGFGEFTVMRRPGLYTDSVIADGDSVCFVDGHRTVDAFDFSSRCRWGPSRRPKLLNRWTELVRRGVGKVCKRRCCDWSRLV